jgi:hypothetical protein
MNVYVVSDVAITELASTSDSNIKDLALILSIAGKWSKWTPLKNALPFGHNLTGPFDTAIEHPGNNRFVPRAMVQTTDVLEAQLRETCMSATRNRMLAIDCSDVVFAYIYREMPPAALMDLAYAYGKSKYIVVSASCVEVLQEYAILSEVHCGSSVTLDDNISHAYDKVMLSVTPKSGSTPVPLTSKFGGLCKACGGVYSKGDSIMWSRAGGAIHTYCYELNNSEGSKNAAVFTAELVSALQARNTVLEQENTMLTARCSAIERQLRGESL